MNEEVRRRRKRNFSRSFVPVITVDGHEFELRTMGEGAECRTRMFDLARFLGELSGDEWNELRKLGAFRGDEETIRLVQAKIDDIMHTLLLVTSERAWDGSGFTLDDLRNAAEIASGLATAYRDRARSMDALQRRLEQVEQLSNGLVTAIDEHLLWPDSGGTYIDAIKHTGELAKVATALGEMSRQVLDSQPSNTEPPPEMPTVFQKLLYGVTGKPKPNVLNNTRKFLESLYGTYIDLPKATRLMSLDELAQHAVTSALGKLDVPPERVSDIKRLKFWLKDFLDDEEEKKRSYDAPLEPLVKGIINKLLERLQALKDDEILDATDAAHPAWWRGCDHGVKQTCEKLQRVATGDFTGKPSFASEEMNALAGDILGLRGTVATLSNIIGELRRSTVLNQTKPEFLSDEVWEDLTGIHERLKSG